MRRVRAVIASVRRYPIQRRTAPPLQVGDQPVDAETLEVTGDGHQEDMIGQATQPG